jgi:hypothetical protein
MYHFPPFCLQSQCSDSVQCFWCGERLFRWKPTDDAILEHARLSPRCRYVTQLLGQRLHKDVINANNTSVANNNDRYFFFIDSFSLQCCIMLQLKSTIMIKLLLCQAIKTDRKCACFTAHIEDGRWGAEEGGRNWR